MIPDNREKILIDSISRNKEEMDENRNECIDRKHQFRGYMNARRGSSGEEEGWGTKHCPSEKGRSQQRNAKPGTKKKARKKWLGGPEIARPEYFTAPGKTQ